MKSRRQLTRFLPPAVAVLVAVVTFVVSDSPLYAALMLGAAVLLSPAGAVVAATAATVVVALATQLPQPALLGVEIGGLLAGAGLSFDRRGATAKDSLRGWVLGRFPSYRRCCLIVLVVSLTCMAFRPFPLFILGGFAAVYALLLAGLPVTPRRPRDWAGLTLLAASCLLGVVILEVGSRYLAPAAYRPSDFFAYDEDCIYTLSPGGTTDVPIPLGNREFKWVPITISPQGIRDPRVIGPKAPDEFRIVMLGDSFTMGHGLVYEETYGHQLEMLLAKRHLPKRVTVILCGVGGYAPWQEALFMKKRGFAFEPDLVIWQIYPSNDVTGSLAKFGRTLPTFEPGWERRLRTLRRQKEPAVWWDRWCQKKSNLYAVLAARMNDEGPLYKLMTNLRFLPQPPEDRVVATASRPPYHEPSLKTWYPELEEAFAVMCKDIEAFRDECAARGIDLMAFVHSDVTSVLPEKWDALNELVPGAPYDPDKEIRVTQDFLRRAGIPYVDVTHALNQLPEETRRELYYEFDGHFTPLGAERVAESLDAYLAEEYLSKKMK